MSFWALTLFVNVITITLKNLLWLFPTSKFITTYTFQIPPPGNKRHHQAMMVMSHSFLGKVR